MKKEVINRAADNIRILSAAMVEKAKSGHPGGAMGGADFINILYSEFLNWDPSDHDMAKPGPVLSGSRPYVAHAVFHTHPYRQFSLWMI